MLANKENILNMKIRANERCKTFSLLFLRHLRKPTMLKEFVFLKQHYFIFAVEDDARKAVEMFCIFKINFVGSNFQVNKEK